MGCCNKNLVQTVASGIAGLTKVAIRKDILPQEQISERVRICMTCPHSTKKTVDGIVYVNVCRLCKCWIKAKSQLSTEVCCDKRWQDV